MEQQTDIGMPTNMILNQLKKGRYDWWLKVNSLKRDRINKKNLIRL